MPSSLTWVPVPASSLGSPHFLLTVCFQPAARASLSQCESDHVTPLLKTLQLTPVSQSESQVLPKVCRTLRGLPTTSCADLISPCAPCWLYCSHMASCCWWAHPAPDNFGFALGDALSPDSRAHAFTFLSFLLRCHLTSDIFPGVTT